MKMSAQFNMCMLIINSLTFHVTGIHQNAVVVLLRRTEVLDSLITLLCELYEMSNKKANSKSFVGLVIGVIRVLA